MSATSVYLSGIQSSHITDPVPADLNLVVTIPAHNEADLTKTLESIWKAERPESKVEVIILINAGENALEAIKMQNKACYQATCDWITKHSRENLRFHLLMDNNLPTRHAGVGLARKIIMDEAALRLMKVGRSEGIIACLDADSRCSPNYLTALEGHFLENPSTLGCSIYFEHPVSGDEFDQSVYEAIVRYELHLRYYKQALTYIGFPFSFHTIGSGMAVRCETYLKQGGMNRRKAGEDFYFLQKVMLRGGFSELNSATVYPSPRPSDRVPFGTGKAVRKWLHQALVSEGMDKSYRTYHLQSFLDLSPLLKGIDKQFIADEKETMHWIKSMPDPVCAFLEDMQANDHFAEFRQHSSSKSAFSKRFYQWFNGFRLLKYLHFARDHYYPDEVVEKASTQLLSLMNEKAVMQDSPKALLEIYRNMEISDR